MASRPGRHARRPWEQVLRVPVTQPEKVAVERYRPPRPPARAPVLLAAGFLALITVGTVLLSLPISNREGVVTPLVTALFTATSAVCVTGLVVVDTKAYWSPFGQAVILLLIQTGGLGFMTSSTIQLLLIGRRVSLRERVLLREAHGVTPLGGILRLTRQVVLMTLI
ncbi:MAG: TrkH family potassium uptake protein, partial [Chloroflexota bacterium]